MFHHHHNLLDNAASMAVQNAVNLTPQHPIGVPMMGHRSGCPFEPEFLDQSEQSSISSAFSSPLSSPANSYHELVEQSQQQSCQFYDWPASRVTRTGLSPFLPLSPNTQMQLKARENIIGN